jgi:hypothetical protein
VGMSSAPKLALPHGDPLAVELMSTIVSWLKELGATSTKTSR